MLPQELEFRFIADYFTSCTTAEQFQEFYNVSLINSKTTQTFVSWNVWDGSDFQRRTMLWLTAAQRTLTSHVLGLRTIPYGSGVCCQMLRFVVGPVRIPTLTVRLKHPLGISCPWAIQRESYTSL